MHDLRIAVAEVKKKNKVKKKSGFARNKAGPSRR